MIIDNVKVLQNHEDITSDDNRVFEETKDGYKLTVAANYPNNPKLVKQEILLDKNSNIKSVTVIDKDGNKQISMNYKKIDLNSKFKNNTSNNKTRNEIRTISTKNRFMENIRRLYIKNIIRNSQNYI